MPKHDAMAQLSRPFQIVLVVVVLFAGVWLFALQGRSTSTSGSGSTPVVSATTPSTSAPVTAATGHAGSASTSAAAGAKSSAGSSGHVYHGPVPGLEGLTRDVKHAREAVAKTGESPQSSSAAATPRSSSATAPARTAAPVRTAAPTKAAATPTRTAAKTTTTPATRPASTTSSKTSTSSAHHSSSAAATGPAGQRSVEAQLAKGDVVLLLFWNPRGTDDVVVHRALQQVQAADRGQLVAVHEAPASQVASFGSVTRGVQVYATPTLFVINKSGKAIVLTGVQEAFSIEQAIAEARQA